MGMAYHRDIESLPTQQTSKSLLEGVREFSSRETIRNYHLGGRAYFEDQKALEQRHMDFFSKEPTFVDPVFEPGSGNIILRIADTDR